MQKRKLSAKVSSRKRIKTAHAIDELPWKKISWPPEAGADANDGILELEEVEGVEIIYEVTENGRIARFNLVRDAEDGKELTRSQDKVRDRVQHAEKLIREEYEPFDSENLLPLWHEYSLHSQLLRALYAKAFLSPTPIQAASLPKAMAHRDVVGVAQTGSGKTLAYGLPILHQLLSQQRPALSTKRHLGALVLAPTRELALQVSSHLNACLNSYATPIESNGRTSSKTITAEKNEEDLSVFQKSKLPPHVSVASIVGGMSAQKQRRILDRGVDVMVATPGRLWDIIEEDDDLAQQIKALRFLVLDEADRMIETGHFAELEKILRLTLRETKEDQILDGVEGQEEDLFNVHDGLQTFVFSATLSKDLQQNVKKRTRLKDTGKHRRLYDKPASTLDDLLLRLDFRDPDPIVIDLSPAGGVVPTLKESKVECLSADKDAYLYYFLLRYPGKSLVFLSSIDGIRRLLPLMELLNLKAFPLHSQLEQRQRLKNLDKFKNIPNSVLLATDIAARGLDIPAVDHVIHYQTPRSADAYVHRNGRTARAERAGFSMLMCAPDERKAFRGLLGNLGRQENEIPELPVDLDILDKLKYRVQLARKIEIAHHKVKKANHEKNWMKETAAVMDIMLDSDYMSDENAVKPSSQKEKTKDAKNAMLKAELKQLLSQPLVAKGISTRYITSGSQLLVDDLLAGKFNEGMVGVKKEEAGNHLVAAKKKTKTRKRVDTSWEGISV